jgi:hypothetical protein
MSSATRHGCRSDHEGVGGIRRRPGASAARMAPFRLPMRAAWACVWLQIRRARAYREPALGVSARDEAKPRPARQVLDGCAAIVAESATSHGAAMNWDNMNCAIPDKRATHAIAHASCDVSGTPSIDTTCHTNAIKVHCTIRSTLVMHLRHSSLNACVSPEAVSNVSVLPRQARR